jgi:hypothetical protein
MCSIEKQIRAFVAGNSSEHAFAGLSIEERKLVKITAEKLGLSSRSFGMGSERQIHIFKPASPPTSTLESHLAAEEKNFATNVLRSKANDSPRTSEMDTTSTKDSDSESQDPQISIKNSFVHFEVDSKDVTDPRIIQSMPAGAFAEHIEAERMANVQSKFDKKGRPVPLPLSEASDTENTDESSGMLFPSTPNADDQMSFSGHGEGVPVVQWVPPVAPSSDMITVLPPAYWASAPRPVESESPAAAMPPAQSPQGLPQGAMAGRAMPESVTVLPPAFWAPGPVSECQRSPPAIPPPQTSPQGLLPQQLLQPPTPSAPPSDAALQGSVTVLPPALWAPAASPSENDNHSVSIPTNQEAPEASPQGLQQQSTPPFSSSAPPPPQFMPGTHVVLQGLASQPDFNGLSGIVNAFDAKCGRYNVIIETGPNAGRRMVKVKFQNLLAQPPCAPGPVPQQAVSHPSRASLVLNQMV